MFRISAIILLSATALAQHFSTPYPVKGQPILSIPQIGMGTARLVGNTSEVVANAIENGIRHIDCAYWYSNQKDVGLGIREGLKRTGLSRSDIWVTGKLFNDKHGKEEFALEETLDQLGLKYLDLFLIHWPMGNATGKSVFDPVPTWKGMEKLVRPTRGTRFIGISNFSPQEVDEVLAIATIRPYVHQFELHPYLQQSNWLEENFKRNLTVIAYAPLGNTNPIHNLGVSEFRGMKAPPLLQNPVITDIATARGCSPAQVVLAWNLKRKVVVIPKAARVEHQKENIVTLDRCSITDADMEKVKNMKVALRLYPMACGYGLTEGCALAAPRR